MLCRDLITLTFSAFSIERWNDHPRTLHLTEMDKQAHKAMIAWALGQKAADEHRDVPWPTLIEGGLFEFYRRVQLTDLKPPVFHKLMADPKRRHQLNEWVYAQVEAPLKLLQPTLAERAKAWYQAPEPWAERLLTAAHFLASRWEFQFVEPLSRPLADTATIKAQLDDQVREFEDLPGVTEAMTEGSDLSTFISLIGQLRFQKRWAQTARVPETSVLGHLLMVAHLAYYLSLEMGLGAARRVNNFYCGLWHDLPEVLTRDIISPVKRSVDGLEDLIKELEEESMASSIYPLIPERWSETLRYYTVDEFKNRYRYDGHVHLVDGDLNQGHDDVIYDAVDGELIEACDKFAAYVEATESIRLGMAATSLVEGRRRIEEKFRKKQLQGYPLSALFDLYS